MFNQIQLRERVSYSYCARSWRQQTNPSGKRFSIGVRIRLRCEAKRYVCVLLNNWFIRQLCVHQDMKHLGSLESTQEARVALGYASSNFYASFVLSKLPAFFTSRWTHLLITQLLSNTHTYRFDSHLSLCLPENRLKNKETKWLDWGLDKYSHQIVKGNRKE